MIILKSPTEIEKMATANKIVAEVLLKLKEEISPGITTDDLDRIAYEMILQSGGVPTFIGYQGYPKTICASVNEEVVHGIPGKKVLEEGNIIGVDCGVTWGGFVGDSAITAGVGTISDEAKKIIRVTKKCLEKGIEQIVEGKRIGDIGEVIQSFATKEGFGVVRDFVGHGVGRIMHEEPQVPNFGKAGTGARIKVGMVLAIEPMLTAGGPEVKILEDGWTVVTKDGGMSAHFEHSVACTEDGPRILSVVG